MRDHIQLPSAPRLTCLILPLIATLAAGQQAAPNQPPKPDPSDLTIEQLSNDIVFEADGTGRRDQTARVRIQSEAGVKELGVLTAAYRSDLERVESFEIQVTKPDGRVVVT